jgi:opacity protein-like surface antigen
MEIEEDPMKLKSVILCAALMMFGVGAASASSTWLGVVGGAGLPTGDYGDVASTGWQFGVTGTRMVNDQWGIGGDIGYHMWNGSNDANAAAELAFGAGSEWKWSALQATGHAILAIPTQGKVSPYLRGGLGIYNVTSKLESPAGDTDASESKLGFNVGAGMNFASSGKARWGVVGQYHIVPVESSNVDFLTVGLNVMWGVGN